MMDAVEYLKERRRLCDAYKGCNGCPLDYKDPNCLVWDTKHPAEAVRIVEEWSKAHPIQTNGHKFRELFGFDPTVYCKEGEEIHDFIADPQWWHEQYEAPKGAAHD